jgi:hypothetical protein
MRSMSDPSNPFGWNNMTSPNCPYGWYNPTSPNYLFKPHKHAYQPAAPTLTYPYSKTQQYAYQPAAPTLTYRYSRTHQYGGASSGSIFVGTVVFLAILIWAFASSGDWSLQDASQPSTYAAYYPAATHAHAAIPMHHARHRHR